MPSSDLVSGRDSGMHRDHVTETVVGEVARVESAHAPETVCIGWCFPCLDGNHDACAAMAHLPETGHLCECPWQPWSAERREYR